MSGKAETDERRHAEFLLAGVRRVRATLALRQLELDEVGVCLRSGLIDSDSAAAWLHDLGMLTYINQDGAR